MWPANPIANCNRLGEPTCMLASANQLDERPRFRCDRRISGRLVGKTSSGLLAANLPLLPRRLQLPVALRVDVLLPPAQHVFRRDVGSGVVQAHVVVVVHVPGYETPGIIER